MFKSALCAGVASWLIATSAFVSGAGATEAPKSVGVTSYTTMPFISSIWLPCWNCAPSLTPAELYFSANPNSPFMNNSLMAQVRYNANILTQKGIIPTAGLQRWEDTYEASFPAGSFPGEPSWIAADRTAGNFPNLPEFVAFRNFISNHPQYADVAFDGGTMPQQGGYFRSWGGQWGHISPLTPLDPVDCPPDMTHGCVWGDEYAYLWSLSSARSGGYGLLLSDFSDAQPYSNTLHNYNPRIIAAFAKTLPGGVIPGSTLASQVSWINKNAYNAWTDFLDKGYAYFDRALWGRVSKATGKNAVVLGGCGSSPSYRRTIGIDERMMAQTINSSGYMCIWDDEIIQVGRAGPVATPLMQELGGVILGAAREPLVRQGAYIEADDSQYWQAIASFYPSLNAASQKEVGYKLMKRLWLYQSWAHICDRSGLVRRAMAFAGQDYWDWGNLNALGNVQTLIQTIVPTQPFGAALYYPVSVERAVEAQSAATLSPGEVPYTYLQPAVVGTLLDSGAPIGYYVSDAALQRISPAKHNVPSAWVVIGANGLLPPAELAALQATAPVVTSAAALAALPNQPLVFPTGMAGFGFRDQNNNLTIVVSNPSASPTASSVTGNVQISGLTSGPYNVTELTTGYKTVVTAVNGTITAPVTLSRWDTLVFQLVGG